MVKYRYQQWVLDDNRITYRGINGMDVLRIFLGIWNYCTLRLSKGTFRILP
jgi:hypothetical protein